MVNNEDNEVVQEEIVLERMTPIDLNVLLTPGGEGIVTPVPVLPSEIEGNGIIWKVNDVIVNEIRIVVGSTAKGFKLTVLDGDGDRDEHGNERTLAWSTGGTGANLPTPPPPPEVSHVIRSG